MPLSEKQGVGSSIQPLATIETLVFSERLSHLNTNCVKNWDIKLHLFTYLFNDLINLLNSILYVLNFEYFTNRSEMILFAIKKCSLETVILFEDK